MHFKIVNCLIQVLVSIAGSGEYSVIYGKVLWSKNLYYRMQPFKGTMFNTTCRVPGSTNLESTCCLPVTKGGN